MVFEFLQDCITFGIINSTTQEYMLEVFLRTSFNRSSCLMTVTLDIFLAEKSGPSYKG